KVHAADEEGEVRMRIVRNGAPVGPELRAARAVEGHDDELRPPGGRARRILGLAVCHLRRALGGRRRRAEVSDGDRSHDAGKPDDGGPDNSAPATSAPLPNASSMTDVHASIVRSAGSTRVDRRLSGGALRPLELELPELDAADLAGERLRQVAHELDTSWIFVR